MTAPGSLFLVPNLLGAVPPANVLPARTIEAARSIGHWVVETPKAARAYLKSIGHPQPIAELSIHALPDATGSATPMTSAPNANSFTAEP